MHVEFLYPAMNEENLKLGPYPFVQMTYKLLRVGPCGDTLAYLNDAEEWELTELAGEHKGKEFSDVIIYAG